MPACLLPTNLRSVISPFCYRSKIYFNRLKMISRTILLSHFAKFIWRSICFTGVAAIYGRKRRDSRKSWFNDTIYFSCPKLSEISSDEKINCRTNKRPTTLTREALAKRTMALVLCRTYEQIHIQLAAKSCVRGITS